MPDASHALAMIAGNRFDYKRASELFRETVRLAPKEPRYWDNLSWSLAYQTPPDGQAAVDAALKAIELQQHFPGAFYHLGRALIVMGRYDEACEAFQTANEQDPDFGARNIGMAQCYLAKGDLDQATDWIDREIRDTVLVNYYRAAILAAAGETDDTLQTLKHTLDQGYRDFATLEDSHYFAALRKDPRFRTLLERYR